MTNLNPLVRELVVLMLLSSTAQVTVALFPGPTAELIVGSVGVGYFFVYLPVRWWTGR